MTNFHTIVFCAVVYCFLNCFVIEAQRRTTCVTPNGERATCTSVYECKHFVAAIRSRNPSQISFVKRSQCGYDTEPLVCCGPATDFSTTRNPPPKPPKPMERRLPSVSSRSSAIPDRKECGFQESDQNKKLQGFIYGGQETEINEFPWMVLLGYRNKFGRTNWNCGGTLISHRYVLTAAHCVSHNAQRIVGNLIYIKLGAHHKTKEGEHCDTNRYCNNGPVITGISGIAIHERYDPNNASSPNDIAVIRLIDRIKYTEFIRPICLPEPNEGSAINDELTVAGWGATEFASGYTDLKLKVEIPFVKRDDCLNAYRKARIDIPGLSDSQICVGGNKGKDSCSGDSGGPLMRRTRKNDNQWYQEGIVSFGPKECGTDGVPGIYTKVSSFLSWIHSKVKE
ncbi:phenoloxidase-activating factor 1-like [Diabrotica undecimpunctata]|uniref:phenoloxidase-activating factor 1-like n=1 Tax=Diabrotica undecimpunctata TaxID=50387 RepID=UPI003B638872